jgi:hypothetical protein
MTRLERRQTRLGHIREKLGLGIIQAIPVTDDEVASTPDLHHHIAKSQNTPVHIGTYLQRYPKDPAIKISQLLSVDHMSKSDCEWSLFIDFRTSCRG